MFFFSLRFGFIGLTGEELDLIIWQLFHFLVRLHGEVPDMVLLGFTGFLLGSGMSLLGYGIRFYLVSLDFIGFYWVWG